MRLFLNKINQWRPLALAALIAVPGASTAADALSLVEALNLAKQNNGTIRAAQFDIEAARFGVAAARGSFLPSVTPNFSYTTTQLDQHTGRSLSSNSTGSELDVTATWRLLDSGSRRESLFAARTSLNATEASARQTLRQTLFSVTQTYYDVVRSQELIRVQLSQVERAQTLLERTLAEIEVKRLPGKDRFQPQADLLNARVSLLNAESRNRSSVANLKALIGVDPATTGTLNLEQVKSADLADLDQPIATYQKEALEARPDLRAQRARLESLESNVRVAKLNAGINWRVDATYARSFARDVSDRSQLGLVASIPLFDGGISKSNVNERRSVLRSGTEEFRQAERAVLSEVESAYYEYNQSELRVEAANAALVAARTNYDSVSAARAEGAANLVDVVVASTTLTTAEVNQVEALYDALIAEARWRLVTGRPLLGEEN